MCLFSKRRKQESIAREIAAKYGMLDDYIEARREGLSPIEALEEWDMLTTEDRQTLEEMF